MDNISPNFDFDTFSIGIDDIQAEAENIISSFQARERYEKNPFPIGVFPPLVQQIINATNESLNFPEDFTGAAMLYAVSLAIGNTHKVEPMKGWQESAVLYLAIVGRAGTNKSHPLTFALEPIFKRDKKTHREYEQKRQEYELASNLTKKERSDLCMEEPVKPVWQKNLVQDFTPEALTEVHKFNKRGIGVYADELASWVKNFNRYSKGSEQEFWLSNWSGKPVIIDRKGGEPTLITKPFIPVIGTIQNAILEEIGKDSRSQNGFIDRILFVMPADLKKHYWSEQEIDSAIIKKWESILLNLLERPLELDENQIPEPTILRFAPDALRILKQWQIHNTDQSNQASNEAFAGIYSKLEVYAVRLSLILQMMYWAAGESNRNAVGFEAVNGAIALTEYFRITALKVHGIIANQSPLDKLPSDKKKLYEALPDTFTTGEGLQIALDFKVRERTFKRFLNDRELFEKVKTGEYEKLF